MVPVDHLAWTREVEALVLAIGIRARALENVTARQPWIGGRVISLASEKLAAAGWVVRDGVQSTLLGAR